MLGALGVPDGWRALGTVALGHPAADEPGRAPPAAAARSTTSSTARDWSVRTAAELVQWTIAASDADSDSRAVEHAGPDLRGVR